ncbi:MAG: DtxR family Mn-dependent transcriptional regulator [Candidatus Paceibacteria bacterium]
MRTNLSIQEPSAKQEDYLRAIYLLNSYDCNATVTNIADKLQLSKSTVSERLKDLSSAKLVIAPLYGKVTLTKEGTKLGQKLTHKHRLIEVFLHETLGMPKSAVHDEAEILEHALSDEVAKRLSTFLKKPTHDPHGSKIPSL